MRDMTAAFRRILFLISLVFFIGSVLVLGNGIRVADRVDDMLHETNAELLVAQLALRTQENQPGMSVQEIAGATHSVSEVGDMIADIQNRIMVYLSDSDFDAYHTVIMPLQTLFISRPYTEMWFPIEAGLAVWAFETIYDVSSDRIPILWSLRTTGQDGLEIGGLVALVRGIYDVSESRFVDMTMHITRYSSTLLPTSPGEYIPDSEIEGENVAGGD